MNGGRAVFFRVGLSAYFFPLVVVWAPVPELRAHEADADAAADQILQSLEEFRPEEWRLPPYEP